MGTLLTVRLARRSPKGTTPSSSIRWQKNNEKTRKTGIGFATRNNLVLLGLAWERGTEEWALSQKRSIALTRTSTLETSSLVLVAQTAQELMASNPISLPDDGSVLEALTLLTDRGIDAAPVINKAGLPVGVLTRTDLLIHEREQLRRDMPREAAPANGARYSRSEWIAHLDGDPTQVRDIMTPTVFTVCTNTPASEVVKSMRELNVHQLFVVDDANALVGVISAFDIVDSLSGTA